VPEVDEEEEEETANTLSAVFPHPKESPKTLKRKPSLIDLVLVSIRYLTPASAVLTYR